MSTLPALSSSIQITLHSCRSWARLRPRRRTRLVTPRWTRLVELEVKRRGRLWTRTGRRARLKGLRPIVSHSPLFFRISSLCLSFPRTTREPDSTRRWQLQPWPSSPATPAPIVCRPELRLLILPQRASTCFHPALTPPDPSPRARLLTPHLTSPTDHLPACLIDPPHVFSFQITKWDIHRKLPTATEATTRRNSADLTKALCGSNSTGAARDRPSPNQRPTTHPQRPF